MPFSADSTIQPWQKIIKKLNTIEKTPKKDTFFTRTPLLYRETQLQYEEL